MPFCHLQWIKIPLLSGRHRGACEKPSIDMWKFRFPSRLPAHLCACALLGKVAKTAFRPCNQNNEECPSHVLNLMNTGKNVYTQDVSRFQSVHVLTLFVKCRWCVGFSTPHRCDVSFLFGRFRVAVCTAVVSGGRTQSNNSVVLSEPVG